MNSIFKLSWNIYFRQLLKNNVFLYFFLICLLVVSFCLVLYLFILCSQLVLKLYVTLFNIINFCVEEFLVLVLIFWILCFFVQRVTPILAYSNSSFNVNLSIFTTFFILCWRPFQFIFHFYTFQALMPLDCFYLHHGVTNTLFISLSVAHLYINNLLLLNIITIYFKVILVILLMCTYLLLFIESLNSLASIRLVHWNLFVIILCLVIFGFFLILSNDLVLVFLNLIGLNIIVYSLIISEDFNRNIIEASLKYFFLSTISSLFFIGGLMLLFAVWKTTNLLTLSFATQHSEVYLMLECLKIACSTNLSDDIINLAFRQVNLLSIYLFYTLFLLFVSFIFKLALFPLHSWAAEIYSAFSIRMLFIFIVFLKGIFFIKFIHIFIYALSAITSNVAFFFNWLLNCIVFGSIFVGSITALFEDKIKKIIAFSSTNQLGFTFAGLVFYNSASLFDTTYIDFFNGLLVSFLFLTVYMVSMFTLLLLLSLGSLFAQRLKFITDVANTDFLLSISIMLLFFSFAGLPPLAGFFIKFYVLAHVWHAGFIWFAIGIILLSVVSCYYYLRIVKVIFFDLHSVWLLRRKLHFFFYNTYLVNNDKTLISSYYFIVLLKCLKCCCFIFIFFLFFFPFFLDFLIYLIEPAVFILLLWVI